MDRICGSLAANGFDVTLVGRKLKNSLPLQDKPYKQDRLSCIFNKGFLFYAEYNTRLFFYLLNKKMDGICAIDLDTILPCLFVSRIKNIPRFYDAHEFFTEVKEVRTRPAVLKVWTAIERFSIPKFENCYTVSEGLAKEFYRRYKKEFGTIRNVPVKTPTPATGDSDFILYQGAVNEARGFEQLVPAMNQIDRRLVIAGDGNFMTQLKALIRKYNVSDKVILKGMLLPEELKELTRQAWLGINFTEPDGLNQYLCLPNKFFDYIQAGIPQVTNNYPEYQKINEGFRVALLVENMEPGTIAAAVNNLIADKQLYEELKQNTLRARSVFHWENEEEKLISIYKKAYN
jgi:glycosyltransferase involved in cell wall biosynthesis